MTSSASDNRPRPTHRTRPPSARNAAALLLIAAITAAYSSWASGTASALPTPRRSSSANAASQQDPTTSIADEELLKISSISPWVPADGEFQIRFVPAAGVPLDSKVTWTLHQRLGTRRQTSLRQQVDQVLDGAPNGRVLKAPVTQSLAELGDTAGGLAINIPIRSTRGDSDRVLLSSPGQYPVEIVLFSPDGPELWRRTVMLNRLSAQTVLDVNGDPLTVKATMLLPIDSEPALDPTGQARFSSATKGALTAASKLITQQPLAPLSLAIRANTLTGLAASQELWASDVLRRLDLSDAPARPVAVPYVRIDTGGLVAEDATNQVRNQLNLGTSTVQASTSQPVNRTAWLIDQTLTASAASALTSLGVTSLVTNPEQIKVTGTDKSTPWNFALPVTGAPGVRAMTYDPGLSLRATSPGATPAVRSHQIVTGMLSSYFAAINQSASSRNAPASIVLLDAATDPELLAALAPALNGLGPISTNPAGAMVPEVSEERRGSVTLLTSKSTDQGIGVLRFLGTEQLISSYRSMAGEADPDVETWTALNNESLSVEFTEPARADLHQSIRRQVEAKIAQIELPAERPVVLTSRTSTVPLRFRNRLPFNVKVLLRIRAPRLQIEGGKSRVVELSPGTNRIDLEVRSRAPGQSLMRIETRSPDGRLVLPTTSLPIRASTISGVGAALSVISLTFLFAWWLVAARRRKRQAARVTGRHPTSESDPLGNHPDTVEHTP